MKKVISILMLALLLASGVHVGINAYSAQKEQTTVTQTTQETTEPAEPEIVDETPEFSEDETTVTTEEPRKVPVKKTVTKAATAPTEEFVEVSEVAVFQQQELLVEEDPVVEETEKPTEETTIGYEPVYDDPLPPEGADWIE